MHIFLVVPDIGDMQAQIRFKCAYLRACHVSVKLSANLLKRKGN